MKKRRSLAILAALALVFTLFGALPEGVLRAGAVETYALKILGTQVTSENCKDIVGGKKAVFDPETNTLKLNGDLITNEDVNCVYSEIKGLTIKVNKDVLLRVTQSNKNAVFVKGKTTITGSGKLTAVSDNNCGIFAKNTVLNIENANIYAWGEYGLTSNTDTLLTIKDSDVKAYGYRAALCGFSLIVLDGCFLADPKGGTTTGGDVKNSEGVRVNEVTIKKLQSYGISLAGTQVTNANCDDILGGGEASYDPETNTLKLNNGFSGGDDPALFSTEMGLTVKVNSDVTLTSNVNTICAYADTVITGSGRLTSVSSEELAINVYNGALTLRDANVELSGKMGICGSAAGSKLLIDNSYLTVESSVFAVGYIGGIALTDCHIAQPLGAEADYVSASSAYYIRKDSNYVTSLAIRPNITKVTYLTNGSSSQQIDTTESWNQYFTLPSNTFAAPKGTRFVGWTDTDSGVLYKPGQRVCAVGGSMTFKATWGYGIEINGTELNTDKPVYTDTYFYGRYNAAKKTLHIAGESRKCQIVNYTVRGLIISAEDDTTLSSSGSVITTQRDTTVITNGHKLILSGSSTVWADNAGSRGTSLTFEDADVEIIASGNGIVMCSLSPSLSFINSDVTIDSGTGAIMCAGSDTEVSFTGCKITVPDTGSYKDAKGSLEQYVVIEKIQYLPGDVDGNGRVNMRDYALLQKYLLKPGSVEINFDAADLTGDGKVNMRDYAALQKKMLEQR